MTTQRVLDLNGPVFENAYVANGMLGGITPVTNIGTIRVTFRPGGTVFGEGKGVITNSNGNLDFPWTRTSITRQNNSNRVSNSEHTFN